MNRKFLFAAVGVALGATLFSGGASAALLPQSTVPLNNNGVDAYNPFPQAVTLDSITVSNASTADGINVYNRSTGQFQLFPFSVGTTTIQFPTPITLDASTVRNNSIYAYSLPFTYVFNRQNAPCSNGYGLCPVNPNATVTWNRNLPTAIRSSAGTCINVPGYSTQAGEGLIQWNCEGGSNEIWTLTPVSDYYHLVAKNSNLCLNVPGWSAQSGQQLVQWYCQGTSGINDQWSIVQNAAGTGYQIKSRSSGLCVNMKQGDAAVVQDACELSSAQFALPQLPAAWGPRYYIGGYTQQ